MKLTRQVLNSRIVPIPLFAKLSCWQRSKIMENESEIIILPPRFQILRTVDSGGVTLTQVAMSHSGRMLFTGTATGALRSIKFPLTDQGEWAEHQGHAAQITKVLCSVTICVM